MTTHYDCSLLDTDALAVPFPPYLSTYWMPLDEPRRAWATFGAEAEGAPALLATAHAFFALAQESAALRRFSLGVEQESRGLFAQHAGYWYGQAEHALFEAALHWNRAAYELETLTATDFPSQDGLDKERAMVRAAHAQHERLRKLTDEVRDALIAWRDRQQPAAAPADQGKPRSSQESGLAS